MRNGVKLWALLAAEVFLSGILLVLKALVIGVALLPAAAWVRWLWSIGPMVGVVGLGFAYLLFGLALVGQLIIIKWLLLQRMTEGSVIFFSWRAARWAAVAQIYDMCCVLFLGQLRGTRFFNALLRALGATIGRNVVVNSLAVSDWDLISIGDNSFIGPNAVVTAHLGEKGVLTHRRVSIGENCTVCGDTSVFPGAVIEDGGILAARSVLAKGRVIPRGTVWGGTALHLLRSDGGRQPPLGPTVPS